MLNNTQIAERRKLFERYKLLSDKYYDELAQADSANAYNYNRKKITFSYKL
jgi:hypothetical protein